MKKYSYLFIPLLILFAVVLGFVLHFSGLERFDHIIWMGGLFFCSLPLLYKTLSSILKGHFGVDLIAIVAIGVAFFMGEYLTGLVVLLMLSGGEALEEYAMQRAQKELTKLLSRAPEIAHLKNNTEIQDIEVSKVKIGDTLIVKPGEMVPVDGLVVFGESEVEEAAITGEALPVEKTSGSQVYSGSINQDSALEIRATKTSEHSTYQKIIQLVKQAQNSKAPVVRLADRYAVFFNIVTFVIAASAWFFTKNPERFLAVLVVATPCPLILATPIAIISGISKAASRGIIVKTGAALEKLAEVKAFIFDKTGTLTLGMPAVEKILGYSLTEKEVLQIASSLDQLSTHILAQSLVKFFKIKTKDSLDYPLNFKEFFGDGVTGQINNIKYFFGKISFLEKNGIKISPEIQQQHEQFQKLGKITVYLANEKQLLGAICFADEVRPETKKVFEKIKQLGLEKIVMLTGDRKPVAEKIAQQLGLTDIHAECLPEDKVNEVMNHKKEFGSVAMVGDGINDAPALAIADVGISIGHEASTASSESGDIVVPQDNLERVAEAFAIAKRTIFIAKQSIFAGMGISIVLMILAFFGFIKPIYGALLQELVDIAVILNALRVNFVKKL